jgi:ubiquinone/menaquinone biosynthesis C-methylase UbiE
MSKYAMHNLMYIGMAVTTGQLSLEGAARVEVERQEVNTYGENDKYIDYVYVDSERLGYEDYSFELTPASYTIDEVKAYIDGPFEEEYRVYNAERQAAVARIATLRESVQVVLQEVMELATKYDLPANITVNGSTNDFRLIDAVDWDSSSMYC